MLLATAQLLQSCPELYELEAQGCANAGLELANAFGVRRMLEMPQEALRDGYLWFKVNVLNRVQ